MDLRAGGSTGGGSCLAPASCLHGKVSDLLAAFFGLGSHGLAVAPLEKRAEQIMQCY